MNINAAQIHPQDDQETILLHYFRALSAKSKMATLDMVIGLADSTACNSDYLIAFQSTKPG